MSSIIDSKRERALVLSIVGAIAFVGFGVGLRQKPATAEYSNFSAEKAPPGVLEARTNEELSKTPWRTDAVQWVPTTADAAEPVTPRDQKAYRAALDARAQSRAYEGAPPTVPHPIGQGSSARECMVCHDKGAMVGTASAPPIPHEPYASCTQCHVPQTAPLPALSPASYTELSESNYLGHFEAPAPYRAASAAPPQQPHQSFMRENCSSCHGTHGAPGLQTSHPERLSCEQCHTASAAVNRR